MAGWNSCSLAKQMLLSHPGLRAGENKKIRTLAIANVSTSGVFVIEEKARNPIDILVKMTPRVSLSKLAICRAGMATVPDRC
jgi:hypothetical protein